VTASDSTPRSRPSVPVGFVLLALLLAYAFAVYSGIGPSGRTGATAWWQPRGFLTDWLASTSLGVMLESPTSVLLAFVVPAIALAIAVFATTGSAVARTLATTAVIATLLFLFYGTGENRPAIWTFFRWRGSVVMVGTAAAVAIALCAPLLARSWLRLGWLLRVVVYFPLVVIVVLLQRNVTGTDATLPFAISPWPVIPFFGLEIGAGLIAAIIACLALALAGLASFSTRPLVAVAAAVVAIATPIAWVRLRAPTDLPLQLATIVVAALALGAYALAGRRDRATPRRSGAAQSLAVGAIGVALPLLLGHFIVDRDYAVTRTDRAQTIIDALGRYYEREQAYPDSLDELVSAKDLAAVPLPQIGFGNAANEAFTYQNFGTSYILEFSAPRWVQCAYNPPWADDEAEDGSLSDDGAKDAVARTGEDGDQGADPNEAARGAWSCPKKPPELW
jgi:hypothetical protein